MGSGEQSFALLLVGELVEEARGAHLGDVRVVTRSVPTNERLKVPTIEMSKERQEVSGWGGKERLAQSCVSLGQGKWR